MKRKRDIDLFDTNKNAKRDGSFHCREKRKCVFENPTAKRICIYSEVQQQQKYIVKLENTIQMMNNKIKELEYQLHTQRMHNDRSMYDNTSIISY